MSLFQTISQNSVQQSNTNPAMSMIQNLMQSNNPQQTAMQMLQQQNPEKFKMIQAMMSQGMNPQMAMQQLGISQQQINMIRMMGGKM